MLLSISPPAAGEKRRPEDKDVPLLSLTHFCRPPFVSFGCVRPGSARSAVLLLQNPSADPAQVSVDKLPRERGFSVRESELLVPPFETLPLTITWTPLEEGGVRELVTFLLNNVVKHQAVLLGRAELPAKKKRNRWNTIKKETSVRPKTSEFKTKVSCTKGSKNKTFSPIHKGGYGSSQRARSSLQSCENLSKPASSPSPVREPRRGSENRVPAALVDPLPNQLQDFTPGSLRRSKTYSVLCSTEYSETIQEVATACSTQTDALIEEEWTLGEPRLCKASLSPINPAPNQQCNFICTPTIFHEYTSYPALSPTEFCKAEVTMKHSQTSSSLQESSQERCRSLLSRSRTPPAVLQTPQGNSLSPDSFVNNSYMVSEEYLTAPSHASILSPDQFVKDNFLTPPAELVARGALSLSTPCRSSVIQEEVTMTQFGYIYQKSPDGSIEVLEPASSRLTFCVKKQRGNLRHLSNDRAVPKGDGKPPIIPTTIIKGKAGDGISGHLGPRALLTNDTTGTVTPVKQPVIKVQDISGKQHGLQSQHDDDDAVEMKHLPKLPVLSNTVTKVKAGDSIVGHLGLHSLLTNDTTGAINAVKHPVIKVQDGSGKQHGLQSPLEEGDDAADMKYLPKLPIISNTVTKVKRENDGEKQPKPLTSDGTKYPVKPPIASATVIKVKAVNCVETQHKPQPKSRRRLKDIESDGRDDPQLILLSDLPVISVSDYSVPSAPTSISGSESSIKVSKPRSICGHKRRSEEISRDASVTSNDSLQNTASQAKKVLVSKPPPSLHGNTQGQRTKTANLASKNPGKIHKVKAETVKAKATVAKTQQASDAVGPPQLPLVVTFKNSKRIVAVAQSKLMFMKPPKTVIPRHPMPFAAKNMFYDERWMAKQERGFTWWLNFILTPDDFAVKTDSMKVNAAALILGAESNHKVSVLKAPTKEEVSLKAYTARCRLNKLRRSACRLFTSEPVVRAVRRLEVEIEARRLLVRKDRHLWKDIGERQKVLNWLLSYNPLWLRIGLETIYGELISLDSNSDVTGLALFILNRLLWNPDIAAEYRHPSVPHLYRDGHEEALSKFTLKKLLLLFFFLDHAKQSRLIDHDPCLFCKDAEFKASKDLLLAFSRDFLSGEGDLSRHLSYLGLAVGHVQTPLHEFDFAVTNLAVDLQCGVRLVRTMELLTQNWSLSKKLRVPAISRLQKMHNVEVAFQVLTERGVQIKDERGVPFTSKDIVDRHRERTLALLWHIVLTFQVDVFLNIDHLKEEIKFLRDSYSVQKQLASLRAFSASTISRNRDSDPFSPDNYSERVLLLMEWVNAVCAFYSTKVENFTVSFSDGRVFCYLINHYHPSYLPANAISQRTTQTVECSRTGTVGLNSSSDSDNSSDIYLGMYEQDFTSSLFEELLENEKANFSLVQNAVSDLGGIPAMIHHSDMSNTIPDEKVVIIYLSFLCARLLDLRKEARAARVIQAAWRRHRLVAEEQLLQKKHKAARVLQRAACKFLAQRRVLRRISSTVIIQKHWRRYLAYKKLVELRTQRQKYIETCAAVIIQKRWRGFAALKSYRSLKVYVVLMQARVRSKIAVASYRRTVNAVRTMQDHVRSWLLATKERKRYLGLKSATAVIQSAYRRWKHVKTTRETKAASVLQKAYRRWQERRLKAKTNAAIVIQSQYRMLQERRKYLTIRAAAVKIQSQYRMLQERRKYLTIRAAAVKIQSQYRMLQERRKYLTIRAAAVKIQSQYRMLQERRKYLTIRAAAVKIQSQYRMLQERRKYLTIRAAAVKIQSQYRMLQERHKYLTIRAAAVKIQSQYRMLQERRKYLTIRAAVVKIQSQYRMLQERRKYLTIRAAAVKIQSQYRMLQERRKYLTIRAAAVKIQSQYRMLQERRKYLTIRAAAVKIQSLFKMRRQRRGYVILKQTAIFMQRLFRANNLMLQERKNYLRKSQACVTIQSVVRGYLVRKRVKVWHSAATRLQARYRMHKARKEYLTLYRAAVVIQRRVRAHNDFLHHRKAFLLMKWSALRLQATYRNNVLRKRMRICHAAAIVIQANYKCYVARKQYQKMLQSALTIQSWYRGQKQKKKAMDHFVKAKWAVAVIQAAYRGFIVRRQVHKQRAAAVVIQSAVRRVLALKKFEKIKKATITIQQRYRAVLVGRQQRKKYLHTCRMVKKIQALWRGTKVRQEFVKLHRAASLIQSYYKMHVCQTKYKTLKRSAELIQSHYRAYLSRKYQRSHYLKMKTATIVLQAAYRGWKARKNICDLHKAACTIQTFYRSYIIQKRYLRMRKSATIIQSWYRTTMAARMQREEYVHLRNNVIKLQSIYRGVKTRQRVIQMHKSATLIQSVFKMHQQRVEFQKWRQAAVVIQQHYRAVLQGRMLRSRYMNLKGAACTLQAAWRRRSLRKRIGRMHVAATVIQSQYRMFRQQRHFKKLRRATIVVQRRYRACQERNKQMRLYNNMRSAALCIQTSFRTIKLQREFKVKRNAARVIQRAVRSLIERRRFVALSNAARIVQKRYKLKKLTSHHRQEYIQLKKAVLVLQAAYRGCRERKKLQEMHSAATSIQAVFRMRKTRAEYQNLKSRSIAIQRYYRSYRSALYEREAFLKLRESAIKLQSVYRGAKVRREITKMQQAASKIQATFKMYLCRRIYKNIQWAVCVMQRRYRAKKMMNLEMLRYSARRDATFCIQANYRGWHIRKELRNQRKAAGIIQRQFRTYVEHKQYLRLKKIIIRIQRLYRATAVTRQCYRRYRSMRKAASCIQAAYRGYKVRKDLDVKRRMATRIQACFRMHRDVVVYRAQRDAACKIQMWYRSVVECRLIRGQFLKLHGSIITIQAAFRGMRVRRNIKTMNEATILIQSSYRMYVHHTNYKSLIKATKIVQLRYRAKRARDWDLALYQTTKRSAILLQAAFRGAKIRKQIRIMHHAATSIQKCVRARLQRERYRRLKSATVCLQRRYRALILTRSERSNFLEVRKAATCIQSAWRAYKAKERLKQKNRAAAVIQASYRMYKQRKSYITLQQAARKIQLRFRANLLRREAVEEFTALKKATVCIQTAFHAMKKREEARRMAAALVIQATFMMHQKRKAFLQIRSAVVVIQAALRAYLVRKKFKELKVSASCIQNWFRRCRQTSLQRDRYLSMRASATVIQSAFRGLMARRIVQREKAARQLQAYLRMAVCRKRFLLLKKSAVKLQSHYRMHRARKLYHRQRASVVLLQRWYRSVHVMREQRVAYLGVRRQVICLQSAVRSFHAQRRFRNARSAAVIIQKLKLQQSLLQAHWRRYVQRRIFFQYKWATLIIQQRYRAHHLQMLQRNHYMRLRTSVIVLQAAFRGSQIRALIRKERAACVIQRFYRSFVVRRKFMILISTVESLQRCVRVKQERARFLKIREAAVCIQRRWRETLVSRNLRKEFLQKQEAAKRLQSAYRRYVVRKELHKVACLNRERHLLRFASAVRRHLSAVTIQRFFRKQLVLKKAQKQIAHVIYIQRWYRSRLQQRNFHIARQNVTILQRAVRAWLQRRHTAAIKIQRSVRLFIQRRKFAKVRNGILKFQALWRGYRWRKEHDTKQVKKLRLRLQQVNEQIRAEDKLCNRTMIALNYLLTYKQISFILAALQHLEVATRLSSVCCENMAQSGAVKTIFTLIRSCNRSIPCMDVIKLSIQVLLNLSKYEGTVCAVYGVENSVEILLNLMQIYREKAGDKVSDKGGSIFTKTCCLLGMFALNTQRAREICAIPKAIDRICSIYKLTARKHRMDAARNIRQQLMNSSQCIGNLSVQATPVRTRIASRIKPDWVLRKDNMREVVDPLKAIQMVMLTLGMSV